MMNYDHGLQDIVYYDWYEVCLSLKVKVTYQSTPATSLCMGQQIWKRF